MILAVFGPSAVGKTTVAKILADQLQLPIRHCGLAVHAKALEMGIAVGQVGVDLHKNIDAETLRWCDQHSLTGGIIEGRFLDYVLSGRADVLFVSLIAERTERSRRLKERIGYTPSADKILAADADDDAFRSAMYGSATDRDLLVLDTTEGAANLWAEKLEQYARQHLGVPLG